MPSKHIIYGKILQHSMTMWYRVTIEDNPMGAIEAIDIQNNGNMDKSDSDSDNYKMVIKNGVLMKKQKQRRYRTERPHECACCNARFTLRSNMERHIKQQHAGESSGSTNTSSISLQRHENDMKEDEDREDDGEDESLESICGDDLLRVNFLAHTDLTHENVSRKFLRHLGFESSSLI